MSGSIFVTAIHPPWFVRTHLRNVAFGAEAHPHDAIGGLSGRLERTRYRLLQSGLHEREQVSLQGFEIDLVTQPRGEGVDGRLGVVA